MIYTYIVKIYHTKLHLLQCCLIRNSKFKGFTTVQQTLSNTKIFSACFKDKPCFLTNIPLNSLNLFHVPTILALTDICALGYQPTLKNTSSLFFAKPLINQKIVKPPSPSPLANLSLYILVFCKAL